MKIKLITYHTGEYEIFADILHKFASQYNIFDEQEKFSDTWLKQTEFYQRNKWIFDNVEKGAGNCLWKPYLILKQLEKIKEGDAIMYMDAQDLIDESEILTFKHILHTELSTTGYCLAQGGAIVKNWTKYDCLYFMDCLDEKYLNSRQLEAGTIAFIKNDKNLKFIKEWIGNCLNQFAFLDCSSIMGEELPGFNDHRNEQAILTLLALKKNMKTCPQINRTIRYNCGKMPQTHYAVTGKKITNCNL